jgi:hypothetical protein
MERTADRLHIADRMRKREPRITRAREINWAHNPTDTTAEQLGWAACIPISIALIVIGINITSWLAMH